MDEYEEVLGEPFQVARQRVRDWAELRGRHIEALARTLDAAGQVTVDELRAVAEATMI